VEEIIDEVESWRVYYELYEGAVVLNQGRKFLVHSLDLARGVAHVMPADVRYYTRSLDKTSVIVLQRFNKGSAAGGAEGEGGARPEGAEARVREGEAQSRAGKGAGVLPGLPDATDGQGEQSSHVLALGKADAEATRNDGGLAEGAEARSGDSGAAAAAAAEPDALTVGGALGGGSISLPAPCAVALAAAAHYGRVRVQLTVSAFVKIWQKTGEIFEEVPLHLPPKNYDTRGCWVDLPSHAWAEWSRKRAAAASASGAALSNGSVEVAPSVPPRLSQPEMPPQQQQPAQTAAKTETPSAVPVSPSAVPVLPAPSAPAHGAPPLPEQPRSGTAPTARAPRGEGENADLDAALHAASHAVLAVIPLHLTCSAFDIGCECGALREHRLRTKRLLFYDRQEGGIGLTQRAAAALPLLLRSARELMASCGCAGGCWMCIYSSKCPEYNMCTSKAGALAVLDILLETPVKIDPAAPPQPPPRGSGCTASGPGPSAPGPVESEGEGMEAMGRQTELTLEEEPSMLGRSVAIFRRLAQAKDLRESRERSARARAGS
jgi:ATP-dependent helicase YprA (DUF1998 family)